MIEWMIAWMNDWMHDWMNDGMNEWIIEWMIQWMNEPTGLPGALGGPFEGLRALHGSPRGPKWRFWDFYKNSMISENTNLLTILQKVQYYTGFIDIIDMAQTEAQFEPCQFLEGPKGPKYT